VHETGHFIVAKLCGVGVKVFSLGFGRRVVGFVHNGTDYRLSLIPAGGYVLMEGADPFQDGGDVDADPDSTTHFMNKPVWQRLLIVAAGPAMNIVLPLVVFTILFIAGRPEVSTRIGQVDLDTPAWESGARGGDTILAVDGHEVSFWTDGSEALPESGSVELLLERDGQQLTVQVEIPPLGDEDELSLTLLGFGYTAPDTLVGQDDPSSPAGLAGIQVSDQITHVDGVKVGHYWDLLDALDAGETHTLSVVRPAEGDLNWIDRMLGRDRVELELRIARSAWRPPDLGIPQPYENDWGLSPGMLYVDVIEEGSPAEASNVLRGDRLISVEGETIESFADVVNGVRGTVDSQDLDATPVPVRLTLMRKGRLIEETFTPVMEKVSNEFGDYAVVPKIGIGAGGGYAYDELPRPRPPLEAAAMSAEHTWRTSVLVVETVVGIFTGAKDVSKTVGGPVQIFRSAAAAAESGLFHWAGLMAGLSVSLAIVNFLPVPVLDGGQFLFYLVEGIRGRPLSLAVRERAQQIGVLLLLGLMFAVLVLDVSRCWSPG
jgi:regulator of sigma E protease